MDDVEKRIPLQIHEDDQKSETQIKVITYDEKDFEEKEISNPIECSGLMEGGRVTWIDIIGLKDSNAISEICKCFDLHPLVIEDILTTRQRPKLEDYDRYLYLVIRILSRERKTLASDQLSLILGKNYVITIREWTGPVFRRVFDSIRRNKGKIRRSKADFLAYALIDAVIDEYFFVLEVVGERINVMEEKLIDSPREGILDRIRKLKNEMLALRRSVWPLRDVILGLERESRNIQPLVSEDTAIYFRDVYDHTVRVMDAIENLREIVSGMLDIYLSSTSNRMNEIMKVLTIIGTIFIPLTFITGIYGMNFDYMPEIGHPMGYFAVLGVMFFISICMLAYFRIKKWI